MLTYLKSHSSCSGSAYKGAEKGFSLVELLIVTALTAIISTIVVLRFSSFDGTVLLKSLAYEVGISIREAQVYSLSVLGTGQNASFETPYGMSFDMDTPKEYVFFQYTDADRPRRGAKSIDLETFEIKQSLKIADICVTLTGPTQTCGISRLDISFRRPDFDAIFFAAEKTAEGTVIDWSESENSSIVSAEVKLHSPNGPDVWVVRTSLLGQISVYKEEV